MAGSTGLEPATSGLTVQCANQAAPRARTRNQRVSVRECTTTHGWCPGVCPWPFADEPGSERELSAVVVGRQLDARRCGAFPPAPASRARRTRPLRTA